MLARTTKLLKSMCYTGKVTRGQWPLRPAATRAMRNRHVMLYDLHYLGIYVHVASNSHSGGLWGHGSLKMASMAS